MLAGMQTFALMPVGRLLTWSYMRHMCTARPKLIRKAKSTRKETASFVDFKWVTVIAGRGGTGAMSYLSLPCKEYAGPDGGNGGNGGHVIFKADYSIRSLQHTNSIYKAQNGEKGYSQYCHGKDAEHRYVSVPVGTLFKDVEGRLLADLNREGEYFIAARGGAGGKGNHFFLSNENRAPMIFEEGASAENRKLAVELRVMAHVGLVGFPNAGKSTLLRSVSRAKPRVAAYPFTTLRPHVGIVEYDDYEQLAVADIPGLIRGAHLNLGLGFAFLRHVERCVCLLYVLDMSVDQPWNQLEALQFELNQYHPGLADRPHAIVANKVDLVSAQKNLDELRRQTDLRVIPVSAKRKVNLEELLIELRQLYDTHQKKELADSEQ